MYREYNDCFYCGGEVKPGLVTHEVRWQGELYLIEKTPTGICCQCSEQFLLAKDARAIDRMLAGESGPPHSVEVPAYNFSETG
ncbi:YgiT-type zinc finger protein [bacterium]|nr:YgiT-type zinc finger protein [bacterium]